jgi:LacI family transcriptional regulator
VSPATVSRVINSPEKVSATLRQRVGAAIKKLHYVPDGAARVLASRQSRTIGAVVPTLDIAIFAAGVAALQARLSEAAYTLLVANAEYDPKQEAQEVRALIERGVDGLVLVGGGHSPEVYELLLTQGIPYVNTYHFTSNKKHPCIGVDNRLAAGRVADYLYDLGHREFAVITSPVRHNDRIAARRDGFVERLAAHGVKPPARRVLEVPYSMADGRIALRSVVEGRRPVTAVVCTNDVLAIGALFECRAIGVAVPQALSVTGFDDLDLAMHMDPGLTTVHVPADEIGRRAADLVLARINRTEVPERVELAANLILRASTGRPPRQSSTVKSPRRPR